MMTSKPKVKQYLVVKFIGSIISKRKLTCVPSQWLNSTMGKIVFVRYPPPNEDQNVLQYITENLPVFCHWQTYLATVYYESDDLGDALMYALQCTSLRHGAQFNSTPKHTTNIQNIIVDESFFNVLTVMRGLTLTEQFKIIRPLVVSILRSIDMFSHKSEYRSQASGFNPHYENLKERASTYAKFLQAKMIYYMSLSWTDVVDETNLLSTPMSDTPGVSAAGKAVSDEVKKAVMQLLLIMNADSK